MAVSVTATRIAAGLEQPVFATAPPGDAERLFIVEKTGAIVELDLGTGRTQTFLDLSGQVSTENEQGLLGLAFDPAFAANGRFYVDFTNLAGDTEIRRFGPDGAATVLTIDQPAGLTNHKAGWIGFGPDDLLYVATGDGGGSGDPNGNAQNPHSLLGKVLRIDPGRDAFPADPGRTYAIPADNPFVGQDAAPEIYALGLRNPWRDSFDRATGQFTIADVGQNRFEEVNLGRAGGNYGWNVLEGNASFQPGPLSLGQVTAPVHVYDHSLGNAVVGGYAYRGSGDALQGEYFFADNGSGRVWTRSPSGAVTERTAQLVPDAGRIDHPSSFGEGGSGELYLVDLDGEVFRLTPHELI